MPDEAPLISIWVTSTGRDYVRECLTSFVSQCTYPNYELLITEKHPDNPNRTWEFFQDLPFPRKQVFDVHGSDLAETLYLLLSKTENLYLNIEDDYLWLCDPGPQMLDAARVLLSARLPSLVMVRMTCHMPVYLDMLSPRFGLVRTCAGPMVWDLGLEYAQHLTVGNIVRRLPEPWKRGNYRSLGMGETLAKAGLHGGVLLRHWGCSIHVGQHSVDGQTTESNRAEQAERDVIVRNGMFGPRPSHTLYSTSANEEQRRLFVYPLYLAGLGPLVSGAVPVDAQERIGPASAVRVA